MKRLLFVGFSASLVLLAACSKQEMMPNPEKEYASRLSELSFTASREVVRSLPDASGKVSWTAEDKIGVWDGTNYVQASVISFSDNSISFSATVDSKAGSYVFVSPYESALSEGAFAGDKVKLTLAAVQSSGSQVVSVAKYVPGETSTVFRNVVNLIRFQVEKEGVVKAVFTGNSGEKLCGSLVVDPTTAETTSSTLDGTEITVPVSAGDNYIAVPSSLSLSDGFKITLFSSSDEYEGEVKSSKTFSSKERNSIVNLGKLDGKIDNYELWKHGKTFTIAGIDYSQTDWGEPKLLSATSGNVDLRAAIHDKTGVFFLEAENGYGFISPANPQTQITKDVVVISRYSGKPVTYKPSYYHQLRKNASLVMKNIIIDLNSLSNAYMCNFGGVGDGGPFTNLHFDGCSIYTGTAKQLIYADSQELVKSIRLYNCYVDSQKEGRMDFIAFKDNTYLDNIKEVVFYNNIFYNPKASGAIGLISSSGKTPTSGNPQQTELVLRQNTFYGVAGSNVLFIVNGAGRLTVQNNLFYAPSGQTANTFVLKTVAEGATVDCQLTDNLAYGSPSFTYTHSNSTFKLGNNTISKAVSDPLSGADPSSGDFAPTSEYSAYGAKR